MCSAVMNTSRSVCIYVQYILLRSGKRKPIQSFSEADSQLVGVSLSGWA